MDQTATLYELSVLIQEHPGLLILATGLGPLLLGLVIEGLGWGKETKTLGGQREPAPDSRLAADAEAAPPEEATPSSDPEPLAFQDETQEVALPVAKSEAAGIAGAAYEEARQDEVAVVDPESGPNVTPSPVPVSIPEPEPEPAPRVRLRDRLRRTSEAFAGRLGDVLGGREVDAALLGELEEVLFTADLGVKTAESLLERVRSEGRGADGNRVREILKEAIGEKLAGAERAGDPFELAGHPHVILMLGVNGAGKTTTIGKLAAQHQARGRSVLLGAGDTFRAAAIEQLQTWGERVGCDVISGEAGGDPASVAFDTVKAAIARDVDIAIIDTAGRLQTKKPLMEELAKIVRVIGKDIPEAPHEILLVLDSNTGQNAISQARLFAEVASVSGLVLSKMDGTAKGGVIVGLADEFGIPVNFVGVGEGIEDLREFEAAEFVDALFGED
ncbi:MAG: signal recognition particle-docking protein FtsY [Opitutales bacterium TMED158]|nr:MAG: signal recognition particle-docking protein FtsY [Opitutales bacterium TMED158]